MTNHPNRRVCPYTVHMIGNRIARFTDADDAQEYAQMYSERHQCFIEVSAHFTGAHRNGSGLIGQYKEGHPTPEFAVRGDAFFPAGVRG